MDPYRTKSSEIYKNATAIITPKPKKCRTYQVFYVVLLSDPGTCVNSLLQNFIAEQHVNETMHLKVKIRNCIRNFGHIERCRTIRLAKIKLRLLNKSGFDWDIFDYSSVASIQINFRATVLCDML